MATVASEAYTMVGEDSKAKEYKITNQKYKNEDTFRMGKEITSKLKIFQAGRYHPYHGIFNCLSA